MKLLFVIELPFDSLTGGSLYEKNAVERLQARGHRVTLWAVAKGRPPRPVLGGLRCGPLGRDVPDHCRRAVGQPPARAAAGRHRPQPLRGAFQQQGALARRCGCGESPSPARLAALERELFGSVDAILVPSQKIRDLLTAAYGVDPRRVSVHPPTAHLPLAQMPARTPPGDRWAFVSLGSITERKNQHILLEALAALRPALLAGRPWTLRLAGRSDAEPAYVARIAAAARALGIEERVAWGPASTAEMLALVAGVPPSPVPEPRRRLRNGGVRDFCAGVPTAFVEGNCALGADARSLPPVRPGSDARGWTDAIESYLARPDHWEALAAAGRRTPRSWDDVAAGIEAVLERL